MLWTGKRAMSKPSSRIEPESARIKPVITLAAVLLPAPLGPISPVMLPRFTVNEQLSTARRPPKVRTRLRTSSRTERDSAAVAPGCDEVAGRDASLAIGLLLLCCERVYALVLPCRTQG